MENIKKDTAYPKQVNIDEGKASELLSHFGIDPNFKLKKIDIDNGNYSGTEGRFLKNVLTLQAFDPDVIRRVMQVRNKLNNGIKLTQGEAEEMLQVLEMKDFPLTDLDISGMEFGNLDMRKARIGGDLRMTDCTIQGHLNQDSLTATDIYQERINVNAGASQKGINARTLTQEGSTIHRFLLLNKARLGTLVQNRVYIKGKLEESDMEIARSIIQDGMQVDGDFHQSRNNVGVNLYQKGLKHDHDENAFSQSDNQIKGDIYK